MNTTRIIIIFLFLALPTLSCCSIFLPERYGYVSTDAEPARKDGKPVVIPKNAPSVFNGFNPERSKETLDLSYPGHNGIDIIAEKGTPVIAPARGIVTGSFFEPFYGHTLIIFHGKGPNDIYYIKTKYYHLNKQLVQKGDTVVRGQQIGELGRTGILAAGILHLHFETLGTETRYQRQSIPLNPHKFWHDGPGIVTCFEKKRKWDDSSFNTTYPVVCK
jgi:murein DD-endopeptidase MepM/ murein hydrolase activator NlpD